MTPERLTEAEVTDLERYVRNVKDAEAEWEAMPVPELWHKVEDAREAMSLYVEAYDIDALLAERRALREALAELESATTMWTSRRSISNPLTNALARARALLAPQKAEETT